MNTISSIVLYFNGIVTSDCEFTTFHSKEDCDGTSFKPNLLDQGIDMGTGDVPVKSINLKERSRIELFSEKRWNGAQVNQKNTFPVPTNPGENNCICFNLGSHSGSSWIPKSYKHDSLDDAQPVQ